MTAASDATTAAPRRRLGAVALGVTVALVAAEVLLRVLGVAAPPMTTRELRDVTRPNVSWHCYPSDPHGEFSPLPDLSTGNWKLWKRTLPPRELPLADAADTPWCVEYRSLSTGVRGDAVTPAPAPGVVRVAGIGDSFAHGDGVPEDRTLFAHLGRELGPSFEVLNCGQSGADLALDVRTLEWVAATYAPQRALVVFLPNDVPFGAALRARESAVFDLINLRTEHAAAPPWWARVARLGALVHGTGIDAQVADDTLSLYRDAYDPAHNADGLADLTASFERLSRLTGGRAVVALYPLLVDFEQGYPLQGVHDTVRRLAEAQGLRVVDLAPGFAGERTADLWVHDVDHHPNGRAHALAAATLAAWLRTQPDFVTPR